MKKNTTPRRLITSMVENVEHKLIKFITDNESHYQREAIDNLLDVFSRVKDNVNYSLLRGNDVLILSTADSFLTISRDLLTSYHTSPADPNFSRKLIPLFKMLEGYRDAIETLKGKEEQSRELDLKALATRYGDLEENIGISLRKLREMEGDLTTLSTRLTEIQKPATEQFEALGIYIKNEQDEIAKKSGQFNNILSLLSGDAMARSYKESASKEKSAADWLRWASIACMALAITGFIYSIQVAEVNNFDVVHMAVRMLQATLLTIPAAYLARESTKHRKQYYSLLQTALDVEAISPYTVSLPDAIQHKIKQRIATKLFAPKNFDDVTKESFPINTQELVTLVLGKIKEIDLQPKRKQKKENRDASRKDEKAKGSKVDD
jgi:hypothetical protein